jgi:predicted permease
MSGWRGAFRRATQAPGLSLAVALSIAVGVGAATGLFGYLMSYLHPRLAAPHADRIAAVRNQTPRGPLWSSSSAELAAIRGAGAFERVSANTAVNATVGTEGGNRFAWGQLVEGDFFELFGGRAEHGRLLAPADDAPGAPAVAVLGHRLWRTAFDADATVVGREVTFNAVHCTVVGVAARAFEGVGYSSEFFLPARLGDALTGLARSENPIDRWLNVRGRLAAGPGALERATAQIAAAHAALDESAPLPDDEVRRPLLVFETDFDPESEEDPFFHASRLLAGAGILFVLLGAANLAGLLLARATARDREWALRKALGASPARLAAAMVAGLLPPAIAGLAGALAVAKVVEGWIEATLLTPMAGLGPGWASETGEIFELDARGVGFALLATAAVVALAAAPPLVRVLRRDPQGALREASAGGGQGRAVLAPRRLLVAAQIALAVMLLVGSGLLARSLGAAAAAEVGFQTQGLSFATINLPRGSGGPSADVASYLGLLERARSLPGVSAATVALVPPLAPYARTLDAARAESPDAVETHSYNIVAPGYFSTLGVPIVAGRALDERDAPGSPPAVVVTRALAERLWADAPAVGRRLRIVGFTRPDESGPDFEVVGVAADAAYVEPTRPSPAMIFFAYGQRRHSRMTLVTRVGLPLAALEPALRDAIAATRDDASLVDLVPADEQLHRTLHPLRLNATVASGLALGGLATSLLGLFALQSYTVHLRRRELAVRAALGATSRRLAALVLREATRLAAVGVLVGLAAAAATVRLLASLLYGVSVADPWTFVAVPLLLATTVLLAAWLPARRAARVDPAENLRVL